MELFKHHLNLGPPRLKRACQQKLNIQIINSLSLSVADAPLRGEIFKNQIRLKNNDNSTLKTKHNDQTREQNFIPSVIRIQFTFPA